MFRVSRIILIGIFTIISFNFSWAQEKIIQGVVADALTKEPIPFANISIKNSRAGTVTDSIGRFKIKLPAVQHTIIIASHISYYTTTYVLNDSESDNINIYLPVKEFQLADVIVSAGLYEQPLEELTKSVSLISQKEMVDNMSSNITDMLNKTPGFTQVWEYHSPIILRGLNSNRLIIMKDGNRRIGTFPGGYFGQDMNIYDSRKVEIIKGPASVIYGSGAISGVINIISNHPFGDKKNSVQVHSGYGSNNNEFLELLKLSHRQEKFGISINGKFRSTGDMVYGNGKVAHNSNVEDRDVSLNTGYKFSEKHKIILNANYHYGDWGKPRGFNGQNKYFTKIRNKEENLHTDMAYSYTPKSFVESVCLNMYYDNGWRDYYQYKYSTVSGKISNLDLVHYRNNYGGSNFYTILNVFENNKLTTGIDGYIFRLDNPAEVFDYYNNTQGEIEGVKNAGQQNLGVFINDEWKINKQWQLISGIRFDVAKVLEGEKNGEKGKHEIREAFSGNLGLAYALKPATHLSFNIGRAFRIPTTEELFTRIISCKGIKIGNPNLKPEYSWNIDMGFRGKTLKNKLKYELALFYNNIDDFINEAPAEEPDADFTLKNTDAELLGGEFSASYGFDGIFRPSNTLYLSAGGAYVYGMDLSGEQAVPLFGIPPLKINITLDYRGLTNNQWLGKYFVKFDSEYAAAQNRVAKIPEGTDGGPWGYVPSEPHLIFNAAIGLKSNKLPGKPKLRFMVKNIFNSDYQPFGSYIPAMGRNFKIILSFYF